MRETLISIEVLGDRVFSGYTRGQTWNGWACPYFTFEQAKELVAAFEGEGIKAWYDDSTDAFSFEVDSGSDLNEVDTFPVEEVEGKNLYLVGAFCWIWEECSELLAVKE